HAQYRRPRVALPQSEGESSGVATARRRVEHDVVDAGRGQEDADDRTVLPVRGAIRIRVVRQSRLAGEPVLVVRADDTRLDDDAGRVRQDRDTEVGGATRDMEAEDGLTAGESHRERLAARWNIRIPVGGDPRCTTRGVAVVDAGPSQ